jgi:hypothetical protein
MPYNMALWLSLEAASVDPSLDAMLPPNATDAECMCVLIRMRVHVSICTPAFCTVLLEEEKRTLNGRPSSAV